MTSRSIFITGAAAGIGLATARRFAAAGFRVGMADIDEATLGAASAGITGAFSTYACDVASAASVQTALESFVAAAGGRLDVVHNNAGLLRLGDFESIPVAEHDRMIDTNIKGVLHVAHAAFPHLKATPGSVLVNMSSASALFGIPGFASCSASKFFVRGLTEALRVEWQRHGIRVCDLMPPFVATGMLRSQPAGSKLIARLGVHLSADDIAEEVWRAVHDDRGVHRTVSLPLRVAERLVKPLPLAASLRLLKLLSGY